MGARPCVALCSGKDCRRHAGYVELRDAVRSVATVIPVRCLDLCDAPVIVTDPRSDAPTVFSKVRTQKQRGRLVAHLLGGSPPAKRQVSGKPRRRALRELAKQAKRFS